MFLLSRPLKPPDGVVWSASDWHRLEVEEELEREQKREELKRVEKRKLEKQNGSLLSPSTPGSRSFLGTWKLNGRDAEDKPGEEGNRGGGERRGGRRSRGRAGRRGRGRGRGRDEARRQVVSGATKRPPPSPTII